MVEEEQKGGLMSSLPDEITINILSRLPVKSILRFRCVCNSWCSLLRSDPDFVKIHLNHATEKNNYSLMLKEGYQLYSIDYNDSSRTSLCDEAVEIIDYPFKSLKYGLTVVGSCNGLICISAGEDCICFWNPSTREYKKITSPPNRLRSLGTYGFGYDGKVDDYKLVRISYRSEVHVYSLRSNSWRSIETIPYKLAYGRSPGVLVIGALHWIATPCIESRVSAVIISFDFGSERFQEVPRPEHFKVKKFHEINVGALGGCLSLRDSLNRVSVEVWVMKDYGVRESWTKLFTIVQQKSARYFNYLRPIKSLNNGQILLEKDNNSLVLYDPEKARKRILKIRGIPKWFTVETSVVGSLVSLNSGTFVGARTIKGSTMPQGELCLPPSGGAQVLNEMIESYRTSLRM